MRIIAFLLLIFAISNTSVAQDYYLGGKIGYAFPSNIGRSSDELGFKDVADNGWQAPILGKWFYNKRLSLGFNLGYQVQDGSDFWDVDNYGDVSTSYQTLHFLANGAYYFSHDEIRPYLGLSFGAYYLINSIDFASSNINNQSITYTAKIWKPGVAPQLGLLFELSKKTLLDIHVQMDVIANMEAVFHRDATPPYTENPHEKQNQISINIGLLFGL